MIGRWFWGGDSISVVYIICMDYSVPAIAFTLDLD